jgi:hypothetical protein
MVSPTFYEEQLEGSILKWNQEFRMENHKAKSCYFVLKWYHDTKTAKVLQASFLTHVNLLATRW